VSIQAVAWALEQDLPARPKLVLVSIANHANHVDGYCWLKAETIARESACSPRAVFNYVGALIRNGYIRKSVRRGGDGKQRANDYWILFARPADKWSTEIVDEAAENAGEASAVVSDDTPSRPEDEIPDGGEPPQDVVDRMHAVQSAETVENPPDNPVEKHAGAFGPHAPACSPHMEEPSKTKPSSTSGDSERAFGLAPRAYQPPPMGKPIGPTDKAQARPTVFVYEGTPAWDAWVAQKKRERRAPWNLTTTATIDGKTRRGWYFPSLFPPAAPQPPADEKPEGATGPPQPDRPSR
jgi:hypothetical protein